MKKIAFSCGDPAGIGIEVIFKALNSFNSPLPFIPVLFGSKCLFEQDFIKGLYHNHILKKWVSGSEKEGFIYWSDVYDLDQIEIAKSTQNQGKAQAAYIKAAVSAVLSKQCDALVTAPINKHALHLANEPYLDHTSMLKFLCGVSKVNMAFYSSCLSVVLATVHCPLKEVPRLIKQPDLLKNTFLNAIDFVQNFSPNQVRIAVAGLNPHAGEKGLFGDEEDKFIAPYIHEFSSKNVQLSGPFSPDTVFRDAVNGHYDCVIAMYHDQGLIPLKLLAFDEAVNVTLGLPFVRCSPDHGTAYDIVGKNVANPFSMKAAIDYVLKTF